MDHADSLGLLIARFDWLHVALRVVGALYLVWIGVKMIREAKAPVPLRGAVEVTKGSRCAGTIASA